MPSITKRDVIGTDISSQDVQFNTPKKMNRKLVASKSDINILHNTKNTNQTKSGITLDPNFSVSKLEPLN